ncbi:hypothetical protein D1Y84_06530 [Acidipila sp. EB88]|nr:hypothetical protein D1Y84_06530 [Acidipila sp. EB88]
MLSALGLGPAGLSAHAQSAQFDLQGPTLEVKVQRAGKTLPIAQVPNLQPGDRLWLHPVLGEHESVHYLMVAVFLRGSTNPPPDDWFTKVEAWNKQVIDEGSYLVVPPGAEQVVILFAPQTGGDFSTLKNAVRGRPGAFVRASQDLNTASLDRDRINKYIHAVAGIADPDKVKDQSNTLARSLSLKVNQDCFNRPADQQAACLQQSQSALILDNGSSSTAQGLLNGPTSDLALQAGSTTSMASGLYDPYISAAFDIARILSSIHTAQFQYIPALSSDTNVEMNLWLNAPPSFHNPKSVLVVALPPVMAAKPPALHPVDPKQVFCMQRAPLVLPVDGAPEIFATDYGHGLTLHLADKNGKTVDLPTAPDAAQGGFVVPAPVLQNAALGNDVQAGVRGYWGFDAYTGPSFKLRSTNGDDWSVADADKNALVVGRDDELHLRSDAAACVDEVNYTDASGKPQKATFKPDGADGIVATLPLKDAQPGPITVSIKQAGLKDPKTVSTASFAEAGKYEAFTMHSGDRGGVLTGTRLDGVASLELHGIRFMPGKLTRTGTVDELELMAPATKPTPPAAAGAGAPAAATAAPAAAAIDPVAALTAGSHSIANATLKDGRVVPVAVTIDAARPSVALINKNVQLAAAAQPAPTLALKLGSADQLPLDGKLTFAIKSQQPAVFAKGESIEVATEDGLASATFSLQTGQLVLQDAKTAIATLDPAKSFGNSAFGRLRLRPVMADGTMGDWLPLATLVRLPSLQSYTCPPDAAQNCTLTGTSLFLLESVATDAQFTHMVTVPDGFAANTLEVPHVANGQVFVKLRDDPSVVNTVSVEGGRNSAGNHHARRGPVPAAGSGPAAPPPGASLTKAGVADTSMAAAPRPAP